VVKSDVVKSDLESIGGLESWVMHGQLNGPTYKAAGSRPHYMAQTGLEDP